MHLNIKTPPPKSVNKIKKKQEEFSTLKLFNTSLLYQTREFFNNSTLHGVRYIAETGRPFGEKFMWFCFTITGAVSALIIIVSLWEKFQTNPTITGLDTDFHNQQTIFPTVIVCPENVINEQRVNTMARNLAKHNEERIDVIKSVIEKLPGLQYELLPLIYEKILNLTSYGEEYMSGFKDRSLRSISFDVAIFCNQTFEYCKYRDDIINCCEHFYPIYSEKGFCYGFNSKYRDTHAKESLNSKFHDIFKTDRKWSLIFRPLIASNIYIFSTKEHFSGQFDEQMLWRPHQVAELLINSKETYTTDDAKQLSIQQRKCIFSDEITLDIFNDDFYTYTDCMLECRLKKCIEYCKCSPPFYRPSSSTPYCTLEQFECLVKHEKNITNEQNCPINCELSCAETVFTVDKLSKVSMNGSDTYINIEFLSWPVLRYKREVLFGWVDLLVSFGGIAGLFLGFSLLSGVEIIYYFTMRACCMLYKDRDQLKDIEKEKILRIQKFYDLSLKPQLHKHLSLSSLTDTTKIQNVAPITNINRYGNRMIPMRFEQSKLKLEAAKKIQKLNFQQIHYITPTNNINYKLRSLSEPREYGYIP